MIKFAVIVSVLNEGFLVSGEDLCFWLDFVRRRGNISI